jgi:hypothetical protein
VDDGTGLEMTLREVGEPLRMAQGEELELDLQQQRRGVAQLLRDTAEDCAVTGLRLRKPLEEVPDFPGAAAHGDRAECEKNLRLVDEVGIKSASAAAGLGGDILDAAGFEAVARKHCLGSAQQRRSGALGPLRLRRAGSDCGLPTPNWRIVHHASTIQR